MRQEENAKGNKKKRKGKHMIEYINKTSFLLVAAQYYLQLSVPTKSRRSIEYDTELSNEYN